MNIAAFRSQLTGAARLALQWRLLLVWLLALLLPLLVALLPLWVTLAAVLDRAPLAQQLLDRFDVAVLADTLMSLGPRGYSPASGLGALVCLLLLMPWLSGTVIAAGRAAHRGEPTLKFSALLKGGLLEYGAMARLLVWAVLPLGLAAGLGGAIVHGAGEYAQKMLLEADANRLNYAALGVAALLFLLAHATVDAARAQLVLEPRRRSVIKAWWRGTRGLLRQPARIVLVLLLTLAGLAAVAVLGWLRTQVAPVGVFSFVLALLLGQALVLALVWQRCARVLCLVLAGRG